MNIVDSSGWLAYFADDSTASTFAKAIHDTNTLIVPPICMYEVFKYMLAQRGEEEALQASGIMSLGTIADLTQEIAINAAHISTELKIAMTDSIILATAHTYNSILWTQDADFKGLEGVEYIQKK